MSSSVVPHEQLRSKHIRTLEALQKVVNENKELKMRIHELEGGGAQAAAEDTHEWEMKCERLDFENQRLAEQLNEITGKLTELRVAHSQTEEQAHASKTKLFQDLNEARTKLAEMQLTEKKLRAVTAEMERLRANEGDALMGEKKRIEELTKENRGLREEVGNWHKQNASLKQQLKEALEKAKNMIEIRASFEKNAERMNVEIEALKAAAKDAAEVHHELEAQFHEAQKEASRVDGLETIIADLKQKYSAVKMENDKLTTELQQPPLPPPVSPTQLHAAEMRATQSESEAQGLREALAALQKRYDDLLQRFKDASAKLKELEASSSDGHNFAGFVKLKRENAVLRDQIKDLMHTQRKILTQAKRVAPGRRR